MEAVEMEALMLEHFRLLRADLAGLRQDVQEVKQRLTSLEAGVLGLRRDAVNATCLFDSSF